MFIEGCPSMGGPESYFVPPCSGKVERLITLFGKISKARAPLMNNSLRVREQHARLTLK